MDVFMISNLKNISLIIPEEIRDDEVEIVHVKSKYYS
jgi:hypothetical protein